MREPRRPQDRQGRHIGRNITVNAWNISGEQRRAAYEDSIIPIVVVDILNGSATGRVVVEEIQRVPHRHMRIQPWTAHETNAEALPLDAGDALDRGHRLRLRSGRFITGTGIGTSTVIRFTPGMYPPLVARSLATPLAPNLPAPGSGQAEVLLHEMCHGLRQMRGREHFGEALGGGLRDVEELFAILVTNLYSSEKHARLRRDHEDGVLANPASWNNSPIIVGQVQRFREQLPDVCARLAAEVRAAFNPFRDVPVH
jgi:hypothetical protein